MPHPWYAVTTLVESNVPSPYKGDAFGRRVLFDCLQAGVVVHRGTTEIVYANAAACRFLGIDSAQIVGALDIDPRWLFFREDGTRMPLAEYPVNRALAGHTDVGGVVLGLPGTGDDGMTWFMCHACLMPAGEGAPDDVVVTFTDVTDLKRAERALRLSDERLRLVLEGSRDAPWDHDLVTARMYYSPRWWESLGLEVDPENDDADVWRRLVHPADLERVDATLAAVLAGNATSYEVEFRMRHADGHDVPVSSRGYVTRNADGVAVRVSGINSDLTERKAVEQHISQLAFHDLLTGLPNRRLLMEQLQRALLVSRREGRPGAVLFIDLDRFKQLNDTFGHEAGDQLLRQVAARLCECVRSTDTVARLAGDEFVIMLEGLPPERREAAIEAERIGANVLLALDSPYELGTTRYANTASIGIALFDDGSPNADGVLRAADLAMYVAKSKGRNRLHNVESGMQSAVDERLVLEEDMRRALTADEMCLEVQPQVREGRGITGVELLVRWRHPERGLLAPSAFLGIAEATGLIVPLGDWVLRTACERLARWQHDQHLRHLTLAVNVSVRQFREPDFASRLLAMLARSGADPAKLVLELTESVFSEDVRAIGETMGALCARGVTFAVDDFGTGSSSLRSLQRLPFAELKIDRGFTARAPTHADDADVVRAVIALARELGRGTIAEGVETPEQHAFLLENNCCAYQGHLFGRPIPLDAFEAGVPAPAVPPAR